MKAQTTNGNHQINANAMTAAELDMRVGHRIRERREALGVTQNRLARQLGVTFSQVQKYEKGSNRIGAGRLYIVAAFLGVPIAYFFEAPGDAQTPASGRRPMASGDELAALKDAFLSITDAETRSSVLALVRSLAASAELAGKPRQIVA